MDHMLELTEKCLGPSLSMLQSMRHLYFVLKPVRQTERVRDAQAELTQTKQESLVEGSGLQHTQVLALSGN